MSEDTIWRIACIFCFTFLGSLILLCILAMQPKTVLEETEFIFRYDLEKQYISEDEYVWHREIEEECLFGFLACHGGVKIVIDREDGSSFIIDTSHTNHPDIVEYACTIEQPYVVMELYAKNKINNQYLYTIYEECD